ncbi:MAG TPA: SDR family oxidoreductase [Ktedonobacterales bacterium]|nr:SDR family oxidoreductase [Ktedonobacterales bacterium]
MSKKMQDTVVVITGASSGIGRATALEFAKRGATIVVAGRSESSLRDVVTACRDAGGEALDFPTDVTNEEAVQRLALHAIDHFHHVDVWVNAAAVTLFSRFGEEPPDAYRRVIETNLFGTIHAARAVLPYFREQGYGVMINLASITARIPQPYTSAYSLTKSGIASLSESLRQELSLDDAKDIHVCTVLPATIDTPLFQHAANYTGRSVQAMPPVYPAEAVARAIVRCALHPKREVVVGGAGRLLSFMRVIAPGWAERMMAQQVDKKHLTDQPAEPTWGNLFGALPALNDISGGWLSPGKKGARRAATAGVAALIPAVVGWLWLRPRSARASRRRLARQGRMARAGRGLLRRAA